jgi:molybdenum cofactor cytidylyltransferase
MTGIIILAAGNSARMGQAKQQLAYQGKTLLQHAVHTALASVCKPVVVVLGASADDIINDIKDEPVTIIQNPQWQEGMASSIRAGVAALEKNTEITAAIIMLCDQPFVDADLINSIVDLHASSRKGMVACAYNNTLGVPALFSRDYFAQLLNLQGHDGAKKILTSQKHNTAVIPFALGEIDIDTPTDYDKLF